MLFGHDNIQFKTINLPQKQKYKNLCNKFGLKKLYSSKTINLPIVNIN